MIDPITDGCEPPCGYWELNSGPLEEQSVVLTTEPSLQLQQDVFYASFFKKISFVGQVVRSEGGYEAIADEWNWGACCEIH
ncbi:hypothetical protein EI005_25935, partial [Escherichia coli]|nr:hypothetical protein [Escherichia coli]